MDFKKTLQRFLLLSDAEYFNILVFCVSALILLSQHALPVYGGAPITLPLKIGMPLSLLQYVNVPFSRHDSVPEQELELVW